MFELKQFFDIDPERHEVRTSERSTPWNVDILIEQPLRIAVELDSARFHDGEAALKRDRRKTESLVQAGWSVIRVWESKVLKNEAETIQTIRRRVARRKRSVRRGT